MPLHHDFLAIELVDQLALALARMPAEKIEELRLYCMEVAGRNGVSTKRLDARIESLRRGALRRQMKAILRSWREMTVNAQEFHVADVYGAALLSDHLYQYEQRHRNWRWQKIARFVSGAFGRGTRIVKTN